MAKTLVEIFTIKRSDLERMVACNSRELPQLVEDGGRRKRWVGIGWVDDGPADGTETLVIDNSGNWQLLSVKLPPELLEAIKSRPNWQQFVRQTLAAATGTEYRERKPGLAGASVRTRKRVSKAGVKGRKKPASPQDQPSKM